MVRCGSEPRAGRCSGGPANLAHNRPDKVHVLVPVGAPLAVPRTVVRLGPVHRKGVVERAVVVGAKVAVRAEDLRVAVRAHGVGGRRDRDRGRRQRVGALLGKDVKGRARAPRVDVHDIVVQLARRLRSVHRRLWERARGEAALPRLTVEEGQPERSGVAGDCTRGRADS